ncbi:MAG: hypothetical protein ACLRVT_05670 [Oscillospiraceae bacterium]
MGGKNLSQSVVAIALLKDYWNLGIGSAMFEELITPPKEVRK